MNRSIRTFIAAGSAFAALASLPGAASAAPAVSGTFDLPGAPKRLAAGPDGNVWVTLGAGGDVARVAPNGTATGLELGAAAGDVTGVVGITAGADGNLYAIGNKVVVKWAPGDPAKATTFTGGKISDITDPRTLVSSGQFLFAASNDKLVKIPLADPNTATSSTPTGLQGARGAAVSSTGLIYIADFAGKQIVAADQNGAKVASYPTTDGPQEVGAGAGGQMLYSDPTANPQEIGRITPGVAAPAKVQLPMTDPFGIASGADGNYWVAQFNADAVTRVTPAGATTRFPIAGLPALYHPRYLTTGPNGTVWAGIELPGDDAKGKIVRISGIAPDTGGGGTKDTTKPAISSASLSAASLRAGQARAIRFTLSERATVSLRFQRALAGKRKGAACVPASRVLRRAKSCICYATVRSRTVAGTAGANRIAFNAKFGTAKLAAGRYRVALSAMDAAGNVSAVRSAAFTVLPPR